MASQSDDAQKHSTLQLFIHDQGGNAPERNRGTAAIELDSTATTQVAFHTAPETWYSSCAPEVVDSLECENREELASKLAYNRRLSKTMIFTILGLFVAVAIAVGVGVGLTKKESSISKAQQALPYHGNIFEGSSLAVIAPPNGDRRLFFQNRNGAIIQALFQASVNKWNTQVVVAGNARNHTPISAFTFRDKSLFLVYIHDGSSKVVLAEFPIGHGGWRHEFITIVDGKDDNFTTTNANASSLSATSISATENNTDISVLYENLNGDMIMIRRTQYGGDHSWHDISPELRSAAPEAMLRSPFYGGAIMAGRSEFILTKPKVPPRGIVYEVSCLITYQNEKFISGTEVWLPGTDRLLATANDSGTFLLSIDKLEGQLYVKEVNFSMQMGITPLIGQFPFSKAAALVTDQSGALIVYHQTNNLSIAEEIWDPNLGGWTNGTWIDYDK